MTIARGQSSIEFLILLAASTVTLLALVVSFRAVFFAGLFALDVENAQSFLSELNSKSNLLSFFGEGSFLKTRSRFFGSARIFSEEDFVAIEVKNPAFPEPKILKQTTSIQTIASVPETSGTLSVELLRTRDGVLIKNSDS